MDYRMNRSFLQFTVITGLVFSQFNLAQAEISAPPPPPPIAPETQNDKTGQKSEVIDTLSTTQDKPNEQQQQFPKPDIVIRYKDGAKIEDYRVNGKLRYSKITPKVGPPYYLIDTDGDGKYDQRHDLLDNPPVQQWLLYSW